MHEKSVSQDHPIFAIKTLPTENREKRENVPVTSSSSDNKKTQSNHQENKPVSEEHPIVPIKTLPTENREKREDIPASSSSNDNKRTPAVSQSDYQENKPPTFVHPVPVDQIIKNANASPQIHS